MQEVTFHNYTITADGRKPKEENLCPIRNMSIPQDKTQLRGFIGCCQQLSDYVKHYAHIAAPLHLLTGANAHYPKPWVTGTDYDIAFKAMKTAMLNGTLYLWSKDPTKRVFIETDASDVGWGAVCYQYEDCISADTLASSCCDDEGNHRLKFDMKKPKRVIE